MPPYLGLRGPKLSMAIGLVAGLCFFLFGYDQGDIGGLLTVPAFLSQFPRVDTLRYVGSTHVAVIQGITVATWNIGCFVSAILTMLLGDMLGRRKTIFLGLTIMMIGEIIQCTSFSFAQFIAGRFIAGFGNGFNTATVPAWQAECTKAHRRGTMLMISAGACIAAGLSFSYWMTFAFAWLDPSSAAWRVPIAIQLFFALGVLATLMFLPESPRWLILSGREQDALKVLSALNDSYPEDPEIRQEFLQIKDAVIEMASGNSSDLLKMGDYRNLHRVILAYILQIFQQISGINLVTQYLALMFVSQYGYTGWIARLIASCAGTAFFAASFVAVVGIDHFWGRRSLMIFGATGMCLCMVILTIMVNISTRASQIAGTVFVFAFVCFFAIGWQGMAWLYQVEIVPLKIRGSANALSTSANWLLNFVVVLVAPVAFNSIGWRTYIIFAVFNAFIVPCIYFFYPETGYRSLEEVDVIFHAASQTPKPWLSVVKIAKNEPLWYGKDGEEPFIYEESEWHQRHVRFSDETKSSDGITGTLGGADFGHDDSPSSWGSSNPLNEEKDLFDEGEAAPAPSVPRTSNRCDEKMHSQLRGRSPGRGY